MEAEERPLKKRRLSNDEALAPQPTLVKPGPNGNSLQRISNGDSNATKTGADYLKDGDDEVIAPTAPFSADEESQPRPADIAPLADSLDLDQDGPPMSKNQQKKLKKKLNWESKRDERKVIRKQKLVAKRERKRSARDQALENGDAQIRPSLIARQKHEVLPITILIDCDFDDLMREPEIKSLAAQITRSYSDNRKAPFQSHLAICSFGGNLRQRFDNLLTHYRSWRGVRFLDCDFVEAAEQAKSWTTDEQRGGKLEGVFSKFASMSEDSKDSTKLQQEAEIVYLSSESDHTLTELKPYSTYIIGGLVDKNREKGICYKRATKRGIKTARLPIGEFMDMQSRKVLATNHVNEIMVRWLECGDWGEAFMKVIPKRKGGKLKQTAATGVDDDDVVELDEEQDEADLKAAIENGGSPDGTLAPPVNVPQGEPEVQRQSAAV